MRFALFQSIQVASLLLAARFALHKQHSLYICVGPTLSEFLHNHLCGDGPHLDVLHGSRVLLPVWSLFVNRGSCKASSLIPVLTRLIPPDRSFHFPRVLKGCPMLLIV